MTGSRRAAASRCSICLLRRRLPAGPRAWLERACDAAGDPGAFRAAFAAAPRELDRSAVHPSPAEVTRLQRSAMDRAVARWTIDELGRAALLLHAARGLAPEAYEALVETCWHDGDPRERVAVLRALPLLPDALRFWRLAASACTSPVEPLFEAIACENPYPARHLPDPIFNRMVLGAMARGMALERIVGLPARNNPELLRLAIDFVGEGARAGRPVPDDVRRLLA